MKLEKIGRDGNGINWAMFQSECTNCECFMKCACVCICGCGCVWRAFTCLTEAWSMCLRMLACTWRSSVFTFSCSLLRLYFLSNKQLAFMGGDEQMHTSVPTHTHHSQTKVGIFPELRWNLTALYYMDKELVFLHLGGPSLCILEM